MKIIYPKNRIMLSILMLAFGLMSTTTYADRWSDGPVLIEIKNNNLCFSVNKYRPRGYFFKSFRIGSHGLDVYNISVSKFQNGVIWEQSLPIKNNGSEFNLKSNQCVSYGTLLNNYKYQGGMQKLYSGKFTVIISGYDPAADQMATFISPFSIEVINGKVILKNVD